MSDQKATESIDWCSSHGFDRIDAAMALIALMQLCSWRPPAEFLYWFEVLDKWLRVETESDHFVVILAGVLHWILQGKSGRCLFLYTVHFSMFLQVEHILRYWVLWEGIADRTLPSSSGPGYVSDTRYCFQQVCENFWRLILGTFCPDWHYVA